MSEEPDAAAPPTPVHGTSVPRGLEAGAASGRGRFGRMFEALAPCDPTDAAIDALLRVMEGFGTTLGLNPRIPAGYTYLGQFVDHDITFDPNSRLDTANDPAALANFRSPRLDLDSVYGSGPADQPYLYDWKGTSRNGAKRDAGVKLLVGRIAVGPASVKPTGRTEEEHAADLVEAIDDVPRNSDGLALIGDPRNDEHEIISQLHLLFLRFHNRVVDWLIDSGRDVGGAELLQEAVRVVRWHYQWIVVHDFLKRICGATMLAEVLKPTGEWPAVVRRHFRWEAQPYIPVEFSGAVYRFGHSMVRPSYAVQDTPAAGGRDPSPAAPARVNILKLSRSRHPDQHLTGFRPLIPELVVDWPRFFEIDPAAPPQSSLRIDTGIAPRLSQLPNAIGAGRSLPRLNLMRGRALGLPSGQDVARAMGERNPMTAAELFPVGIPNEVDEQTRRTLLRATPLWYYILAEAASARGENGLRLGPVGGRIVAEVLLGLIEGDPASYMSQAPAWIPEISGTARFTMAELVTFTNSARPAATDAAPPG